MLADGVDDGPTPWSARGWLCPLGLRLGWLVRLTSLDRGRRCRSRRRGSGHRHLVRHDPLAAVRWRRGGRGARVPGELRERVPVEGQGDHGTQRQEEGQHSDRAESGHHHDGDHVRRARRPEEPLRGAVGVQEEQPRKGSDPADEPARDDEETQRGCRGAGSSPRDLTPRLQGVTCAADHGPTHVGHTEPERAGREPDRDGRVEVARPDEADESSGDRGNEGRFGPTPGLAHRSRQPGEVSRPAQPGDDHVPGGERDDDGQTTGARGGSERPAQR